MLPRVWPLVLIANCVCRDAAASAKDSALKLRSSSLFSGSLFEILNINIIFFLSAYILFIFYAEQRADFASKKNTQKSKKVVE